jgi:anaerobic selenocysteine-containing dehydrogenase
MAPRTVRSTCPHDCPDACGLLAEVEGGRVLSVRGDPDHFYSQGTLCPKVKDYDRTVHAPGRLLRPMLRDGPKGSGRFRPVSWEEAVARVAERFRAVADEHGGEAILPYSYAGNMGLLARNAGHAFFHRLGASRLDRTICSSSMDAGWRMVMGSTPGSDPDDVLGSDLVLLWSANVIATSIHFASRAREARRRGARVVLIETWRTPTAALADQVLLVRPGSDGALALSLLHVLEREGLVDRAFVAAQVQGWEDLARQVLPRWTPARGAEVTGLPAAQIEELARSYGRARGPFLRLGYGLSRYGNGAGSVRAIACLPAAVGAWARPGGGMLASAGTVPAVDLSVLTREELQPGKTRLVNMNQLGHALNQLDRPRVHALYVYTANPAAVTPDQNAVLRGLAREDLFTVVHERFLTDTARWADVLLPAPTSLECHDLYRSYGQFGLQRTRPVIPPLGESKSNWETFGLLAQAMGFGEEIFRRTDEQMVDLLLAKRTSWTEGIDRAALDQGRAVPMKVPRGSWHTPSGKIEIRNPVAVPLRLQTAPALDTLNSSFGERADLVRRQGTAALQLSPADAAARGLAEGEEVVASNALGEVRFRLEVTDRVPAGVAVAAGVPWLSASPGGRNVNALTSQRLTDAGGGSTFYDNRVEVRRAPASR